MDMIHSRTWAEIHLENILFNYRSIKSHLPEGTRFLGVVKANAYGHGAVKVAGALEKAGCDYLAVAALSEAIELREAGISLPILILGYTPPAFTKELIAHNITQSVSSLAMAEEFSRQAGKLDAVLKTHLKLDSGMGRLGFVCHSGISQKEDVLAALKLPHIQYEGVFTHFAVSELLDTDYTDKQYKAFLQFCDQLEDAWGQTFAIRHCANSGATLSHPDKHLGMVRPGIALYGLYPGTDQQIALRPAMELKTRIYQIKDFEKDISVSYGRRYITPEKRTIAVIPIGYADGLHRVLSGTLEVLIHGKRAQQVGSICMDMCMIDITHIPEAKIGDVVTVFGFDHGEELSVDEAAEKAGTISYELLCAVSPPRPQDLHRVGTKKEIRT